MPVVNQFDVTTGKEKLVNFIRDSMKTDMDRLIFEHESLRAQCQQLVNQVKILAQEQLELVNLVMNHHCFITQLTRRQENTSYRLQEVAPSSLEKEKEGLNIHPSMTVEMQVFDEMQRIIEKYKQQQEAMELHTDTQGVEPHLKLSGRDARILSTSVKDCPSTPSKPRKRRRHFRTLYSRMKSMNGTTKKKSNAEDIKETGAQTESKEKNLKCRPLRSLEQISEASIDYKTSTEKEFWRPELDDQTTHSRSTGKGRDDIGGERVKNVSEGQKPRHYGRKIPMPSFDQPRPTVSHLFSLLDDLKLMSAFVDKSTRLDPEEEVPELSRSPNVHPLCSPHNQDKYGPWNEFP